MAEWDMADTFRQRVAEALQDIGQDVLSYNEGEYWMIRSPYEYIEYYAKANRLYNTAVALPLARGLHDGTHRRASVTKHGVPHRLPYVIHCLLVCRMLVDLQIPLPRAEEDIVLAAALCHDMIEDLPMEEGGRELYTRYHLDPRVYETVQLVTKRKDFTPGELDAHFRAIQENKLALLVKLSDRGHNIEDLYNMSGRKIREYIDETRTRIMPMCQYGLHQYPDLVQPLEIFEDKLIVMTRTSEEFVDHYEQRLEELKQRSDALRRENDALRKQWQTLAAEEV